MTLIIKNLYKNIRHELEPKMIILSFHLYLLQILLVFGTEVLKTLHVWEPPTKHFYSECQSSSNLSSSQSTDSTATGCARRKGRLLAPAGSKSICTTLAAGAMLGQRSSLRPCDQSTVVLPAATLLRIHYENVPFQGQYEHSMCDPTNVLKLAEANDYNHGMDHSHCPLYC
jgi:hypothetical protein